MKHNFLSETSNPLELRKIAKMDRSVTFFGLGTVPLGRPWGIAGKNSLPPNEQIAKEVLQTSLKMGISVIDTASSYGCSELRIGQHIPQEKNQYLLISKPGEHNVMAIDPACKFSKDGVYCSEPVAEYDFSRSRIFKDIDDSLDNLRVKKLDVALLHLQNDNAVEVLQNGEATQALLDLKKEGKVNYIGVSVNGPGVMKAIESNLFDIIELEYSLINQKNEQNISLAHQKGMGVIVRGGLGTGLLTSYVKLHLDKSDLPYGNKIRALLKLVNNDYDQLTALALAFLYNNKHISSVILGADRPEFILKDIQLLTEFNNPQLLARATQVAQKIETPDSYTESMGLYFFNEKNTKNEVRSYTGLNFLNV